jgi:hypothetical protein
VGRGPICVADYEGAFTMSRARSATIASRLPEKGYPGLAARGSAHRKAIWGFSLGCLFQPVQGCRPAQLNSVGADQVTALVYR